MEILVITGMSGAGKSEALNVVEDLGYFAMDNLPPALIPKFAEIATLSDYENKVAVVVDVRSGKFFDDLSSSLDMLRKMNVKYRILFLDADLSTIIKRYKERRRPHPLNDSIVRGYEMESEILSDIKKSADFIINTSEYSNKNLKDVIKEVLNINESCGITVAINSFGFKNGILLDGDIVFDVRFLPNPFYIPELKSLDGTNESTKDFVLSYDITRDFIEKTVDLLEFLIPNYFKEGKTVLVVGFGCTGGFHRSVVIAEEIGRRLRESGNHVVITHRDKDIYG